MIILLCTHIMFIIQVWGCAFEPDAKKPGSYTSLLATCGGNSVCITDVETASVKFKFNADIR